MGISAQHILLVLVVGMLLFGRGKISELMGDFAKGIKIFKNGLAEGDEPVRPLPRAIEETSDWERAKAK